jgi:hypothetical protein
MPFFVLQVDSHSKWLNDVVAHCENNVRISICECFHERVRCISDNFNHRRGAEELSDLSCVQVTIDFPIIADPTREIAVK